LLICAFIANAASFVLPISNPANLVVYGKHLPALLPWLRTFLLPSICSILVTYAALRWISRDGLGSEVRDTGGAAKLSPEGRHAAWGIVGTGAILIAASGFGLDLGLPACVSAALAVLVVTRARGKALAGIVQGVSWSVLPLVAGLFVLVAAVNRAGALHSLGAALQSCARLPKEWGALAASVGAAGLSNIVNNLPSGLLAGGALQTTQVPPHIRDAVLIGVDLGPNLSVTGSLATILWLIALRREGERIDGWQFLKTGSFVMPPALLIASVAASLLSR
jgi:arsenical pump membrane protein